MDLREEFRKTLKYSNDLELLFQDNANDYIKWLENKYAVDTIPKEVESHINKMNPEFFEKESKKQFTVIYSYY